MKFTTKAQNLKNLKKNNIKNIPKLFIFSVRQYKNNKSLILKKIKKKFDNKIAIRSSSIHEDQKNSMAGSFVSFLNLNPANASDNQDKIEKIIKSYEKFSSEKNEIFVQEMVMNIKISGVLLTRELQNYIPCYNFNYYSGKNSTVVTSGKKNTQNLIYIKNKKYKIKRIFINLIKICDKIKKITNEIDLDIEFAINNKNKIFILQVRKLAVPKIFSQINTQVILNNLEKKIKKLSKKHYNLFGKTTFFGVMPDWNPAEIIGRKPKPLALSLYQELVTDHVWSENRKIYGYKDLSQFHLMTTFYGTPYVDVRIDFNSWLPENLNKKLSEKLINYYLANFKNKKHLHDKVEFEILFTCYTLDTEKKVNHKLKKFLSKKEIKFFISALKNINKKAIVQIDKDHKLINELIEKQEKIRKTSLYYFDKIYWLIEDCKKFGTLPFAGLARCAFIAAEILNSFVNNGIFTEDEKIKFLSTITTITSELKLDLFKNKRIFIKKYGHLRPGTYEITSPNYEKNFENYFGKTKNSSKEIKKNNFKFSKIQKYKINKFIKKNKVYKDFDELILFIKKSIKYREYSKFIFTKSIDLIFQNLENFGKKFSINVDDLSYIKLNEILDAYFNLSNIKITQNLKKHIKENRIEYKNNNYVNLPDVITTGRDLFIQNKTNAKINFISRKLVNGKIIRFDHKILKKNLNGIICIENADPGYDFLFTKNIKGLVTMYGGQNSHMAIRCAELNIPALIGVGEKVYNEILENKFIRIDCYSKKIELLK